MILILGAAAPERGGIGWKQTKMQLFKKSLYSTLYSVANNNISIPIFLIKSVNKLKC
jgi:hypothetical protein